MIGVCPNCGRPTNGPCPCEDVRRVPGMSARGLLVGVALGLVMWALIFAFAIAARDAYAHHCKPGTRCERR